MKSSTFTYADQDGVDIFVYKWEPDAAPKAAIQISHGLAEHAGRYDRLAKELTDNGYICYADDHRGHGKTAEDLSKAGVLGPGGWESTVKSLKMLTDIIKKENSSIPFFFIGHSWGSLMGQDYIQQWGSGLTGCVLSGSSGKQPFIITLLGKLLAEREVKKIGAETPSPFLDKMTFGAFNKPYEPAKTKFQWLSRDQAEVDKYVEDPFCGFLCPAGISVELIYGITKIWKKENESKIPGDLPLFIIAGSEDAASNMTKSLKPLVTRYKEKWKIKDVTHKFYPGGRHEVFNEINREEVFNDVIGWLDSHLP